MIASRNEAGVHADPSTEAGRLRLWWAAVTALLLAAVFAQAVFAGMMLSGVAWARAAHAANAFLLIASTVAAGGFALFALRHVSHGARLGLTLLSLAALIFVQTAVGRFAAEGANLMWVHIPLGVALVGFAGQAAVAAGRLGRA
jgi:hypothetical protein